MPLFRLFFLLVPLVMLIGAIAAVIKGLRMASRIQRLNDRGQRATGRVISSRIMYSRSSGNNTRTSRVVETIDFTTGTGQHVRAVPVANDGGDVDRSGLDVTVLYDPDRPEIFVAPKDGQRMGRASSFVLIIVGILTGIFTVMFVLTSQFALAAFS